MLETLLETKSIPLLLVFVVVFMCAEFIRRLIEFLWKIKEKNDSVSEAAIKELTDVVRKNTQATEHLDQRLCELEETFSELPKLKRDIKKYYWAIKSLAGERWPEIRDTMKEEDSEI